MENSLIPFIGLNRNNHIHHKSERTLVIGFGSEILTDDGIALKIISDLKHHNIQGVDFQTTNLISLEILALLPDYKSIVLIDATTNVNGYSGKVCHYLLKNFEESLHLLNFHDLSIHQMLEFAKAIKMSISDDIHIITIGVSEVEEFGDQLSETVSEQYPKIYNEVFREIEKIKKQYLVEMSEGRC